MRLGEICQLDRALVRKHDDVHYFALAKELRLKNESSIRSIPIHPALIDIGLLDFISGIEGALFPDLPTHVSGRKSDAFGKHFARFLKSLNLKHPKLDFHSFRHTFVAGCDASRVEFSIRERLLGHDLKGQAGRYGQSYEQEQADMDLLLARHSELRKLEFKGLQFNW